METSRAYQRMMSRDAQFAVVRKAPSMAEFFQVTTGEVLAFVDRCDDWLMAELFAMTTSDDKIPHGCLHTIVRNAIVYHFQNPNDTDVVSGAVLDNFADALRGVIRRHVTLFVWRLVTRIALPLFNASSRRRKQVLNKARRISGAEAFIKASKPLFPDLDVPERQIEVISLLEEEDKDEQVQDQNDPRMNQQRPQRPIVIDLIHDDMDEDA